MRYITYSEAVREALAQEMAIDSRVFIMGEDVGVYGGSYGVLKGLIDQFGPERVRDTPISEAGFTGAAVGAAMTGTRPVVEIMYSDFLTVAMDQIVNHAAKIQYMFNGSFQLPLVLRSPCGAGTGAAAQHSQSPEAWFTNIPGLKVVVPSDPYDVKGLLASSIRDSNPVLFFEPKMLYSQKGEVPEEPYEIPLGVSAVKRDGYDVTVITYGSTVPTALQAADILMDRWGVSCRILDLRTLVPLDEQSIIESAEKTRRVVILHEAPKTGGFGAEIAARIAEHEVSASLEAPLVRVCGKDVPIPFAENLEAAAVPNADDVAAAVLGICDQKKHNSKAV